MKILLTGAAGFAGKWLVRELADGKHTIFAADLSTTHATEEATQFLTLDITKANAVTDAMQTLQPDACIHLAALAFVPAGETDPRPMMDANLAGTVNILTAIRDHSPQTRLLFVSTSQVYGNMSGQVTEETPTRPISLYGISKLAAEHTVRGFVKACGIDAVIARPTNHTGPGQSEQYVIPAFAQQVKQATTSPAPTVMRVGNLDSERAFMDVRDVVKAYAALVEQGQTGETYNIGNGPPVAMRDILGTLCRLAETQVETAVDNDLWRPTDRSPELLSAKILADTSWRPAYSLEQTLADVLDHL